MSMPFGRPSDRVHPRVCGETSRTGPGKSTSPGPSPRVRGNPASAPAEADRVLGPSPRVRGNLRPRHRPETAPRSIPACAGKPTSTPPSRSGRWVHPRVCGETAEQERVPALVWGPSPRVRGNLVATKRLRMLRVHPRVCGETPFDNDQYECAEGPSPRVRGNPPASDDPGTERGSIPACAGKPTSVARLPCSARVHPRVCGETSNLMQAVSDHPGPSPRVRGNLVAPDAPTPCAGSIPACAGKPGRFPSDGRPNRVHPRVCGETPGR